MRKINLTLAWFVNQQVTGTTICSKVDKLWDGGSISKVQLIKFWINSFKTAINLMITF